MSGTAASPSMNALQALGQQLAAALIAAAGPKLSAAQLVFLPGGLSVPDDIVQSGIVNPTQLQTWLAMNFDYPFVAAAGETSVQGRDESHGTATQLYSLAVTKAQPIGDPQSDTWKRVAGQITGARASLGPPGEMLTLACEPDDWPLPGSAQYWTKFDFTETQTVSVHPKAPLPVVNPRLWMVRSLDDRPAAVPRVLPTVPPRAGIHPLVAMAEPSTAMVRPNAVPVHLVAWRSAAATNQLPQKLNTVALLAAAPSVKTVSTTSSAAITVHLEHQIVTIGRFVAGQPWWDGTFLADTSWYIPGMTRGGLLPTAGGDGGYALPVAMVLVRNFRISGQWSHEAAGLLLSQGGTVGPLSLFGAAVTTASDGVTVTFAHDGMQAVALLCTPLPVLPPADSSGAGGGSSATGHS